VKALLHRRVWQRLPRGLRRGALFAVAGAVAPRAGPGPATLAAPLVVAGALRTASGLGESARLCLEALSGADADVAGIDLGGLFMQRQDLPAQGDGAVRAGPGVLILHVNAPLLPLALLRLGRRVVRGKRIVGYWAWELPQAPPDWRTGLRHVHDIWVPSRFTAAAVDALGGPSARVVPHPLPPAAPQRRPRADFGMPDGAFLVALLFDMGSGFTRKNPLAAIAAFRQAFGDDRRHHLAIKVAAADAAPAAAAQLRAAVAGAANISLHDRVMSRAELQGWLANADAVLSLHRAEGFGLVAAEAMQLGLPVVATNWSGNLDFMTAENSALVDYTLVPAVDPQGTYDFPGQRWAEPAVGDAAGWLRRLADDRELGRRLGAAAAATVATRLGPAAYRARVGELLRGGA
jgi:glycosyltransferase involved in cell wall biosynthesis